MSRGELRRIVEASDTPAGRTFDVAVGTLIVAAMVALSVESLPGLSDSVRGWLKAFEWTTLVCFAAEYALRLYVAERPLRYATSFFGAVDLLAILPSLVFATADTRAGLVASALTKAREIEDQ